MGQKLGAEGSLAGGGRAQEAQDVVYKTVSCTSPLREPPLPAISGFILLSEAPRNRVQRISETCAIGDMQGKQCFRKSWESRRGLKIIERSVEVFGLGGRARRCRRQGTRNPDCHFPFPPQTISNLLGERDQRRTFWMRQSPPGLQPGSRKDSGFLHAERGGERPSGSGDFPAPTHKLTQKGLHPEPECWWRSVGGGRSWEGPGSSW